MYKQPPISARKRVTLASLHNPTDRFVCVLNPNSLSYTVSIRSGELEPIGWSGDVDMYGGTKSVPFTLVIHLSQFLFDATFNEFSTITTVKDAIAWLTSFCYAEAPGLAPSPLLVEFPNTLVMSCKVLSITVDHKRWDADLNPREAIVTLNLKEMREQFKTSDWQRDHGFRDSDEGHSLLRGAGGAYRSGIPMKTNK